MPRQAPSVAGRGDHGDPETFRGRQDKGSIRGRHNDLTASFNQEEIESLEKEEKRPFFGQNSAIGGEFNL